MKRKLYLVLDTETATYPFANKYSPSDKKKVAIANPIIYDIGWVIMNRQGEILKETNYLITETFFNMEIFNTAYFVEKRDIYLEMLEKGTISLKNWKQIKQELEEDLQKVDISTAYNCCFDFKKAIPKTDQFIDKLYTGQYKYWMKQLEQKWDLIINKSADQGKNEDYLTPNYDGYPLCDLWGLSCKKLLNTNKYRKFCYDNNLYSPSKKYFSTTAETCYRYLTKNSDFKESHTALDDAKIEAFILKKILTKGKIEPSIIAFPFRIVGKVILLDE